MDSTMRDGVVDAAARYLYGYLEATEDLDAFCLRSSSEMRGIAADAVARCIERFDGDFRASAPRSWSVRGRPARTVVTTMGAVTYRRTLYSDEYGRNRYPADELLGIPRRARFSSDAFLWILRRVSTVSFRRAAADFEALSGVRVSAMCVWRMVQREGGLIREAAASAPPGTVSQDRVFVESDGIFLALQSPGRRAEAIDRFLYEQGRSKRSFEMKCGAVYAGKAAVGKRAVRGNVSLVATCGGRDEFWGAVRGAIGADYAVGDIAEIRAASDGGGWCRDHGLEGVGTAAVTATLDSFHVMQAIWRAFPEGRGRDWLVSLALRRRPEALADACARMLPRVRGPRRERVRALERYVRGGADLIRNAGNLGTMEATNAYVWAKRMKSFGCSWSRRGAESMALLLCRTCAGKPPVPQPKDAFFDEGQLRRERAAVARRGAEAARRTTSGSGWEPPRGRYVLEKAPGRYLPNSFVGVFVR